MASDEKVEIGVSVKRDGDGVKQAQKDIEDVGKSAEEAGQKAKKASFDFKEFAQNAGLGATALLTAAGGIVTASVKAAGAYEQSQVAFKTLLGDSKKAQDAIKEIENMAKATPFNLPDLIKANQLLLSAGVKADDARSDIKNLGDAISATGGSTPELMRLTANLQQIKAVGKATAMDIRQFGMAGIDIYTMLADTMGLSVDQVKDMDIGYTQLSEAFAKAAGEGGRFHNAMADQAGTLQGLISNVQDAIGIGLKDIAVNSGLFDVVKSATQGVLDTLNLLVPKLTEFFTWIGSSNTALAVLGGLLTGLATAVFVGFLVAFGPIILATLAFAAAGALVGLVLSYLWPTIQTVTTFLREHGEVMAGLVGFITVLAIPSLLNLIKTFVSYGVTLFTKVIPAIVATGLAHLPLILVAGAVALAVGLLYKAWSENWNNIRYKTEVVINWIIGKINALIEAINQLGLINVAGVKLFDIPKLNAVSIANKDGGGGAPQAGEAGFIGPVQNSATTDFGSLLGKYQSMMTPQMSSLGVGTTVTQYNTINTPTDYTQMFRDISAAAQAK